MLDKILVPLDGSDLAENVLPVVEELAEKLSAEVILLQAVTPSTQAMSEAAPGAITSPELSVDIAKRRVEAETGAAERYLESVRQRLADRGLTASTSVTEGAPAAAILQSAKDNDASLIALATHGRGGLARAVMGSVADAVVRNAAAPVLLVRSET